MSHLTDRARSTGHRGLRLFGLVAAIAAAGATAVATARPAPAAPPAGEGSVRIGGSTTLLPIVTKCAKRWLPSRYRPVSTIRFHAIVRRRS